MENAKQIDGIYGRLSFKKIISARLSYLRFRVFRQGRHDRQIQAGKNFIIFALLTALLFGVISGFEILGSGIRVSKQILGSATTGFELLEGGQLNEALLNFETAGEELENSKEIWLKILNSLVEGLTSNNLRGVSSSILSALDKAILGLKEFQNVRFSWEGATNSAGAELYFSLRQSRSYLVESTNELNEVLFTVQSINPQILPSNFKQSFLAGKERLVKAQKLLREAIGFQDFILNLLGGEKKTYLLIFQNNNEARATGGFIGTYGLLEFENGQMRILKIESIYNLDGQLQELIAAPWPLRRAVTKNWALRDSNWFVDFPMSSRKMLNFLEKENGTAVAGIISFTPDVFENLLKVTGPIEMPEYNVTLTAENFRDTVQFKTSEDFDREANQPKRFLADFAPRFLKKMENLTTNQWINVFQFLSQMVAEKQLLMFSFDSGVQQFIRNYGIDGGIKKNDGDYLAIFHSNVGGGKTDLDISQKVEKNVSYLSGGLAIINLKITRTNFNAKEKFFPQNLDFMRILVPQNAKLLSARGFDDFALASSAISGVNIDPDIAAWEQSFNRDENAKMYVGTEAGYQVFANWLELAPGQTKTVELTYEIILPDISRYTFLLQKQPGAPPFEFALTIDYFPGEIVYYYPESLQTEGQKLLLTETVKTDRFYGVIGQ